MRVTIHKENLLSFAWALLAAYAALLIPAEALAATFSIGGGGGGIDGGEDPESLSNILCNVVNWFTGPLGGGIATLAIIVIGIGALMGKVSWGMAIIVGLGIGVIFGASQITTALGAAQTC